MNSQFDGGHGVYGAVLVGVVAELGRCLNRPGRRQAGPAWKHGALLLALLATPVILWLANGNGL